MSDEIPERCDEVRDRGALELYCELNAGHDGWHRATVTDSRIIATDGVRSEVTSTETVSWELSALQRAMRAIKANKPAGS